MAVQRGTTAPVCMYEGLPGSGKSLRAVREALRVVVEERRPVYTNLPFQWRVVKRWLRNKHGEEISGLLRPMDREDFVRFLQRACQFSDGWEREQVVARQQGRRASYTAWVEAFNAQNGEPVAVGESMNWMPPGSFIIIDEVHKWFPAGTRGKDASEPPELLRYLSMVRHFVHEVIVITQNRMQVSVTIRRMVGEFWHVRNMAKEKLLWNIRYKHVGITAFQYGRFDPQDETREPWRQADPEDFDIVFPWLPSWRYYFRLYQSFTFAGRPWQREEELRRARLAAGLDADGRTAKEREERKQREQKKLKGWQRMWFIGKVFGIVGLCGLAVAVGLAVCRGTALGVPHGLDSIVDGASVDESYNVGQVRGFGKSRVLLGDEWVSVGESIAGLRLAGVDARRRRIVFVDADGVYWVGDGRSGDLARVGRAEEIVRFLAELRAVAARRASESG